MAVDLGEEHLLAEAQKRGKKYIRYFIMKDGMPLYLGHDTIEKLRELAKKSQTYFASWDSSRKKRDYQGFRGNDLYT